MDNIEKFQNIKRINEVKIKLNRAEVDELFKLSEQNENWYNKIERFALIGKVGYSIYKKIFKH